MIRIVLGGFGAAFVGLVLMFVQGFTNRHAAFSFEAAPVGMVGVVLFGCGMFGAVAGAIWLYLSER